MDAQQIYMYWWSIADQDKDGELGRNDSLQFFQRSGLQSWVLANIWKQVNPQDAPNLGPTQFVLACQLIGLAQAGQPCDMTTIGLILGSGKQPPLPTFQGIGLPNAPTNQAFKWEVSAEQAQQALNHFSLMDPQRTGFVSGQQCSGFFGQSGLTQDALAQIWTMSDVTSDGRLDLKEFCLALFLIQAATARETIIMPLPVSLIHSIWTSTPPNPLPNALKYAYPPQSINVNVFATNNPTATTVNKPSGTPNPFLTTTPSNPPPSQFTSSSPAPVTSTPTVTNAPTVDWKPTADEFETFKRYFNENKGSSGQVEREQGRTFFLSSGIDESQLVTVYSLCDLDKDGRLSLFEFSLAMKIIRMNLLQHVKMPAVIPSDLLTSVQDLLSRDHAKAPVHESLPPPMHAHLPPPNLPAPTHYGLSNSNAELESEFLEARAKVANLTRELQLAEDNFTVIQSKNRTNEQELKFTKERLEQVEALLNKKERELREQARASNTQTANELAELQSKVSSLERVLAEKDATITRLKTEFATSLETQRKLVEKETQKKLDVMTELQQAMDRIRTADGIARTLEAKIQDLDQQVYALKRQQPAQQSYLPPPVTQQTHLPPPNLPAPTNLAPDNPFAMGRDAFM